MATVPTASGRISRLASALSRALISLFLAFSNDDLLDLSPFEPVGRLAASPPFVVAVGFPAFPISNRALLFTVSNCFSVRTRFKRRSKKPGEKSFFRF